MVPEYRITQNNTHAKVWIDIWHCEMWLFEDEIHEYIVSWGGAMLGDGIQIIKELQDLT